MKLEYTIEDLQQKIFTISLTPIRQINDGVKNPSGSIGLSKDKIDKIINLFAVQQKALIEEIEKRLPEKQIYSDDGSMTYTFHSGKNEVIDQITESLEAIKKELE